MAGPPCAMRRRHVEGFPGQGVSPGEGGHTLEGWISRNEAFPLGNGDETVPLDNANPEHISLGATKARLTLEFSGR